METKDGSEGETRCTERLLCLCLCVKECVRERESLFFSLFKQSRGGGGAVRIFSSSVERGDRRVEKNNKIVHNDEYERWSPVVKLIPARPPVVSVSSYYVSRACKRTSHGQRCVQGFER
jgi:hypothetical protein